MQVGIRLHDVAQGTIEQRAHTAREQGFSCAHIALSKLCDYKMTLPELTPGWAMYIKKVFAKEDVDIAVLGCYLNLATPDKEALAKTQEIYKAHLRFASILGCGVVGTETGAPNKEYKFEEACHTEEALQTFITNLRPVVRCAENAGVIFALEPVYKHIMWNPKQTRKVLDAIDSPNLRIIFDPVNLLDISNYERREEIFAEAMETFGDEIAMIHLKDFTVEEGKLNACAAGSGMMNYDAILKYAKQHKPYVHATLENTTPENAVKAREFIEKRYEAV
ncbi:MAG: sugar phosphate isomerase/epimerase [Lachnospiraceae bacterium]|nr:sugar phosphate isomerase/epimerase [Lachnospiraceae bacterium]